MTRWFPWGEAPEHADLVAGDRLWEIGTVDQVWTGTEWTRACPKCDEAMTGHWEEGWLCCRWCRLRAVGVPRREVAPC